MSQMLHAMGGPFLKKISKLCGTRRIIFQKLPQIRKCSKWVVSVLKAVPIIDADVKRQRKQCSLFCMCKNCQNKSIEGETTDQSDLESSLSDSDLSDFSDDTSSQSDHLSLDDPTEILDFPSVNDTLYELPVIDVEVPFLDQTEECSMQF